MPPRKTRKSATTKKRAQTIAVRVVRTQPKIKPVEPVLSEPTYETPPLPPVKKVRQPAMSLRPMNATARPKMYVWLGAGLSFAFIIVAWVFFIKLYPSPKGPNSADQTLINIGKIIGQATQDISEQADRIRNYVPDSPTPQQLEVLELDQKVFPEFYR